MSLYYIEPKQEIFEEVKAKCIELWKTYDDTYGYATEKIDRIKDIHNIKDNFMYMVAMFDDHNQERLSKILSPEAKKEVRDRISSVNPPYYNSPFLYEEK